MLDLPDRSAVVCRLSPMPMLLFVTARALPSSSPVATTVAAAIADDREVRDTVGVNAVVDDE